MHTHSHKSSENKSQAAANASPVQQKEQGSFQFVDNRPEAAAQLKLKEAKASTPSIVQKLAFSKLNKDLSVPQDYYDKTIPGITPKHPIVSKLPQDSQSSVSVKKLYESQQTKAAFLNMAKQGLMLSDTINTISPKSNSSELNQATNGSNDGEIRNALKDSFLSYRKVLEVNSGQSFYTSDGVQSASHLGLLPSDYIPEADDLVGSEGKNIRTQKDTQQRPWWGYACRLIALAKCDTSFTKTKALTSTQQIANLKAAVQALHDHYYNTSSKVMYDDSSSSTSIYKDWGYSLKFVGPSSLNNLPLKTGLSSGEYIFDITGHSVRVTVNKDITKGTALTDDKLDEYFTFDSDHENYSDDEKTKKVHYIWSK
ncbi:hypothetical protein [Roseivirga pacifica]